MTFCGLSSETSLHGMVTMEQEDFFWYSMLVLSCWCGMLVWYIKWQFWNVVILGELSTYGPNVNQPVSSLFFYFVLLRVSVTV